MAVADLEKMKNTHPNEAIVNVFRYLEAAHISLENFISELKEDFAEEKLISVNSKEESEQKQLAVNSLENVANAYRAVFAVDKLNEGWDVLNLFDIVRLYDTRDGKAGKPGKTTMAEAQLIGRGARYCPFRISETQPLFKRKFDDAVTHELRIGEELYYHSAYNPRYIQELNTALTEIGIKAEQNPEQLNTPAKEPATTRVNQTGSLNPNAPPYPQKATLSGPFAFIPQTYTVSLPSGYSEATNAFGRTNAAAAAEITAIEYKLTDFGEHIIRKAINRLPFYQFAHLKSSFPKLTSISEFISSDNYLGNIKVKVTGAPAQTNHLSPPEKLAATLQVLEEIAIVLAADKWE